MQYYYRTGPFQHDDDAILIDNDAKCLNLEDVINYVTAMDTSLSYLNHYIYNLGTGDRCIVRFDSPRFPIYKKETFYPDYLTTIH